MNSNIKYLIKYLSLFGLFLCIVQPLQATEWGDLTGQFIYTGKSPNTEKLKRNKDQSLVIGKNGGIKNIFIYLRDKKSQDIKIHSSYHKLPKTVLLSHQNSMYSPHTLGLWYKHQKMIVINKDLQDHYIHLFPLRNHFSDILPKEINNKRTFRFDTNEIIPTEIKCDIHPWETAYLLVLAHPYFSTTDDTGSFTIKNLPVGEHNFRVWHEKVGNLKANEEWKRGRIKMKIKPGKNDLGEIKVDPQLFEK